MSNTKTNNPNDFTRILESRDMLFNAAKTVIECAQEKSDELMDLMIDTHNQEVNQFLSQIQEQASMISHLQNTVADLQAANRARDIVPSVKPAPKPSVVAPKASAAPKTPKGARKPAEGPMALSKATIANLGNLPLSTDKRSVEFRACINELMANDDILNYKLEDIRVYVNETLDRNLTQGGVTRALIGMGISLKVMKEERRALEAAQTITTNTNTSVGA